MTCVETGPKENVHILIHLGQVGLQAHVFGPGGHLPAHGRRLGSHRLHPFLHFLPDTWDAHEGRGARLLQGIHQRALTRKTHSTAWFRAHVASEEQENPIARSSNTSQRSY